MTSDHELERLLDHWIGEGVEAVPDHVLNGVAARIIREPQHPAWRHRLWRLPMTTFAMRAAAIAAAAVIALLGGVALLGGSRSGPASTPAPVPSQTSTASQPASASAPAVSAPAVSRGPSATTAPTATPIACEDGLAGCAGSLAAGPVQSAHFSPKLELAVPGGWVNTIDTSSIYKLDMPQPFSHPSIIMFANPEIAKRGTDCNATASGLAHRAADWVSYLTADPDLDVSKPTPVLFGDVTGHTMDITIRKGHGTTCSGLPFPVVQFILAKDAQAGSVVYGAAGTGKLHLTVVDVGSNTLVIWIMGGTSPIGDGTVTGLTAPVLQSLRFP